jgi:Double-GTPase 2
MNALPAFLTLSFIIIGSIVVSILATAFYALALPACFLYSLASAIWTEAIRSPNSEEREGVQELTGDSVEDSAGETDDEGGQASDSRKRTASAGRAIEIGWSSHDDREIAMRSYYFGPFVDDMRAAVEAVSSIYRSLVKRGRDLADLAADREWAAFGLIAGFAVNTGIAIGRIVGLAAVLALGLIYMAVNIATTFVAMCAGLSLLGLDSAMRFAAGITMTCPNCASKVFPYPHYRCPSCSRVHRNIRPGGYGILTRVCICGARFPTMLLTGAGKLDSICSSCQRDLPRSFGHAAEVIVPMFGASNAGKTRLMLMLTDSLLNWVYDQGGTVNYVDDSAERLSAIKDGLQATSNTEKTPVIKPRGYGLHIRVGLTERIVTFFDAAGELYLREDGLGEMKFLDKAKTYIYVADPLSSDRLWTQLSLADQDRLAKFKSGAGDVAEVYQRTVNQMLRMARRKASPKLAFSVSKVDLLHSVGYDIGARSDAVKKWVGDASGLDMEDIVRDAGRAFSMVNYFGTAAIDREGQIDDSVAKVLRWVLANAGIDMGMHDA